MKKIVELIVKLDEIELDGVGVDAIALVENPAIELDFLSFKEEKFVYPTAGESEDEFISRCIPVLKGEGYPDDQAAAICYGYWEGKFKTIEDDKEMVDGIIDLILQIEDLENRKEVAQNTLQDFALQGVMYDLNDFIARIGLDPFNFDLDEACWPGYEAIGMKPKGGRMVPNCVPVSAEKFESYTDYPESATNAAKRALEWRDSHPDQGCGTRVGWARANQLAKREPISEETIARMASFARHLQYKDVPYSEGCGGLMVDAWGGQAGIEWAQNKLEEIRNEFAINTSGLSPYVDQTGDPEKRVHSCQFNDDELTEEQKWILSQCENMGEEYDPHTAIFVDASAASFNTVTDFLKGIAALDILGQRKKQDTGETVYRYSGPSAQRGFCRAMLRLNKVYRPDEVSRLNSANPGFGAGGSSTYSVLKYKGGPNCRHYWEQLSMFKNDNGQTVFISYGPVNANTPGAAGISETDKIAAGQTNNAMRPSSAGSVPNNAYLNRQVFSIDDDQRIVIGPAMIPSKMIKRKDDNGNPYWVYFTEQTIRDIAEDYFEKYKQNNTNIEHNSDETHTKNTLLESWIVEDSTMDKSALYGFSLPKGSWMVSYKINDDETWRKIKNGELRGFSVEGFFLERGEAMEAVEQTYRDILDILNQIED